GDTVNPGALACLRRLGVAAPIEARGLRVDGMVVTGANGASIDGRYQPGVYGRAILRRDLDWLLLQRAIDAGCAFEPAVAVRAPVVDTAGHDAVVRGALTGT